MYMYINKIKLSFSENIILIVFLSLLFLFNVVINNDIYSQCKPIIKIDNKPTVVNTNDDFGLTLPYWLKAGQTLAVGSSVTAISVIEFSEDALTNTLSYSKVISIDATTTTLDGTVPIGKVWKIESIAKLNNSSTYKSATFGAGSYTWKVPSCAEEICVDMWGAGGGGGGPSYVSSSYRGGGGGGGGYGSQCFAVAPGDTYNIVVGEGGKGGTSNSSGAGGAGGTGGTSSITGTNISMTVTGGIGGGSGTSNLGGSGGSSTASSNAEGAKGENGGLNNALSSGGGGAGANGGDGGARATAAGIAGSSPGGGGSGGVPWNIGGVGGNGKVIISW